MDLPPARPAPHPEPETAVEGAAGTSGAPEVRVVVVACDPGPWFEEALASIATQDYPALSLLVVDAGSSAPVADRVRAVVPGAQLDRIEDRSYSRAANRALEADPAVPFLVHCHDDVRLAPDAVRLLVEETFRSNAGVAAAKLVGWDDPTELLQVGMSVDKLATPATLVDPGEMDQEQHDAVRDVFYAPGGCFLIRSDLFRALGGFDETYPVVAEDLDLCWRAHLVGARVLVVPAARVAHREALDGRLDPHVRRRLDRRHRARIVLTCYSRGHLMRVLPQAAVVTVLDALLSLLTGHVADARSALGAWTWNLRRLGALRARRRAIAASRQVEDREIRELQVHGFARVSRFVRGQSSARGDRIQGVGGAGRSLVHRLRDPGAQRAVLLWIVVVAAVLVGSRHLLTEPFPSVGEYTAFPDRASDALRLFGAQPNPGGLGGDAPAPSMLAAIGILGAGVLGNLSLLRTLLIAGGLLAGLVGAWRLPRAAGSRRAQMVALVAYATVPVGVDSVGTGHASGLVLYALAPFLLGVLARASGQAPFEAPRRLHSVLVLGLLIGVGGLLVPTTGLVVVLMAVGVAIGSALAGQPRGALRALGVALGGAVLGAVLLLPWSSTWLTAWGAFARPRQSLVRAPSVVDLLRFRTGEVGLDALGWGLLFAAALGVLIGRDWRLAWAIRGWFVAMATWAVAVAGVKGWLPVELPPVEVLLAPAAAGLALAVAMGMSAFEIDLRDFHFGWRQIISVLCGAVLVLATVPWLVEAVVSGRWGAPSRDLRSPLAFIDDERQDEAFRVLWVGDPDVVPLTGWVFDDAVVYQVAGDGFPGVVELFPGDPAGVNAPLDTALADAASGRSSRLGAALAGADVRYLLLAQRFDPSVEDVLVPDSPLVEALPEQLDLAEVELSPAVRVWENTAWTPDSVPGAPGGDEERGLLRTGLVLTVLVWVVTFAAAARTRGVHTPSIERASTAAAPTPPDAEVAS